MKRTILAAAVLLAAVVLVGSGPSNDNMPRVYALATATVEPGHLSHYMNVVEGDIIPFLSEEGVEVIGVFRNAIGGPSNQLILLLAYQDMAHFQTVSEHSTLTSIQRETFESMRVLSTRALTPVPFSPLQ